MQGFPALACGLIVRSESCGNVRGRAGEIDDDFAFQVESGELIKIFFRNLQAVANEDQRRGESGGGVGEARTDMCLVGERKRFGLAAGDESERGFGFIDLVLVEVDGLVEAVRAGGLEAGFLELLDGIGLGLPKTFTAGVAAFERIVRKEFYVRPPRIAVEVGRSGSLLRRRNGSKDKEKKHRQNVAHEFHSLNK